MAQRPLGQAPKGLDRERSSFDRKTATDVQLKDKLYAHLDASGLIQNLKSQLRSQVLGKLRGHRSVANPNREPLNLVQRTLHSLIAEHLQTRGFHHTLSVFLPESGMGIPKDKGAGKFGLDYKDAARVLRLDPDSNANDRHVHARLHAADNSRLTTSKLEAFVDAYATRPAHVPRKDSGNQTVDQATGDPDSVDWKLKRLDEKYAHELERERAMPFATMEERMQKYQRETDARAKQEIEQEVARIRATEIAQVRVEERMRYRRELQVVQQQIEEMYKARLSDLHAKEVAIQNELKAKKTLIDDNAFQQRQRLLDDMERMREREASVRRQEVENAKRLQLENDRLAHKAMTLDRQITDYDKAKREVDAAVAEARRQAKREAAKEWEGKIAKGAEMRILDAKMLQQAKEEVGVLRADLEAKQAQIDQERKTVSELKVTLAEEKALVSSARLTIGERERALAELQKGKEGADTRLAELAQVRDELEKMKQQFQKESESHALALGEKEKRRIHEVNAAVRSREEALKRANEAMNRQKALYKKRQRVWEVAIRGLQKQLALKSRQERDLDAARENDRRTIRNLQIQLDQLRLDRGLRTHFDTHSDPFPGEMATGFTSRVPPPSSFVMRNPQPPPMTAFSSSARMPKGATAPVRAAAAAAGVDEEREERNARMEMEENQRHLSLLRETEEAKSSREKYFRSTELRRALRESKGAARRSQPSRTGWPHPPARPSQPDTMPTRVSDRKPQNNENTNASAQAERKDEDAQGSGRRRRPTDVQAAAVASLAPSTAPPLARSLPVSAGEEDNKHQHQLQASTRTAPPRANFDDYGGQRRPDDDAAPALAPPAQRERGRAGFRDAGDYKAGAGAAAGGGGASGGSGVGWGAGGGTKAPQDSQAPTKPQLAATSGPNESRDNPGIEPHQRGTNDDRHTGDGGHPHATTTTTTLEPVNEHLPLNDAKKSIPPVEKTKDDEEETKLPLDAAGERHRETKANAGGTTTANLQTGPQEDNDPVRDEITIPAQTTPEVEVDSPREQDRHNSDRTPRSSRSDHSSLDLGDTSQGEDPLAFLAEENTNDYFADEF